MIDAMTYFSFNPVTKLLNFEMLHRISYESLKKAAIYGAVLSVSGCSVLYYLIQRKTAVTTYTLISVNIRGMHSTAS